MPSIHYSPRKMQDGTAVSWYYNTVGTEQDTYTFPTPQEYVKIVNKGTSDIEYTLGAYSGVLKPSETIEKTGVFSSFSVRSTERTQAFEVISDEEGSTIHTGGSSSSAGALAYNTLTDLQTALPGGSNQPVWVRSEKSWYYWEGDVVTPPEEEEPPTGGTDTTIPVLTVTPAQTFADTMNVTMSATDSGGGTPTIYYTLDDSDPKVSGTKIQYTAPITLTATDTIKAYAVDASGNESVVQTVSYTKQTAPVSVTDNYALTFNGTSSIATSASNMGITGSQARSIEVRFKTPETIQNGVILAFGSNVANQLNEICIRNSQIFLDKGALGLVNVSTTVVASTWYHLVFTYDGTTLNGYVNGTFKRGEAASLATVASTAKMGSGVAGYFKGDLDFARVYNRALTASEVSSNQSGTITRDGLVNEWLLNEGTGTAISDTAGTNNMTVTNTTWVANT